LSLGEKRFGSGCFQTPFLVQEMVVLHKQERNPIMTKQTPEITETTRE
jgi:hypothetical protein